MSPFGKKPAQQSVHLTGGILRHFRALSTPEQNPALGVLSRPAHPQVTQTVGRAKLVRLSIGKYEDETY
jgi:hypothetical protein